MSRLCKAPENCQASDIVGKVKCCFAGAQWEEADRTVSDDLDYVREQCARCGLTDGRYSQG
jgi:hypothetical protein